MKILLDAMGGDNAPIATIKGAVRAVKEIEATIVLIGQEDVIRAKTKELYNKEIEEISDRILIHNCTESIEMEDIPTHAIRTKKDSSMVKGFNLLKEAEGDIFISAGNSGALLTGAILLVGRIKGIDRPAIAPMLPTYKKGFMLIDAGTNTNCKSINLLQFAQMANIYLKKIYNLEKPAIGLLNIGTEENKGNDLMKESYQLLKAEAEKHKINFIGNIEGRGVFEGNVDALVTDGFTGNIFLKTVEGMGKLIKRNLNESFKRNILTKLSSIFALNSINRFAKTMDYKEYGGAIFLGVKKPIIKAHGSSDEYLFYFTIKQAEKYVKSGANEIMIEEFNKLEENQ